MSDWPADNSVQYQVARCVGSLPVETRRSLSGDTPRIVDQIERLLYVNQHRIPSPAGGADPQTGIPDAYIYRIIDCLIVEWPRIQALMNNQHDAWARVISLVSNHTQKKLSSYRDRIGSARYPLLLQDVTSHCTMELWQNLDRYPFDTTFDSWVYKFVQFEVSSVCRYADFRNDLAQSLDEPLFDSPDLPTLGDIIPDGRSAHSFEQAERSMFLEAGIAHLGEQHQQLMEHLRQGMTTKKAAEEMGIEIRLAYRLHREAIQFLRAFFAGDRDKN